MEKLIKLLKAEGHAVEPWDGIPLYRGIRVFNGAKIYYFDPIIIIRINLKEEKLEVFRVNQDNSGRTTAIDSFNLVPFFGTLSNKLQEHIFEEFVSCYQFFFNSRNGTGPTCDACPNQLECLGSR